jgi:hypothetical protein
MIAWSGERSGCSGWASRTAAGGRSSRGLNRTDVSYLPDLQAYLDNLLRNRERHRAATDIDA